MNNRKRTKFKFIKKQLRYYERLSLEAIECLRRNKETLKIENAEINDSTIITKYTIIHPVKRAVFNIEVC